jgi:hypothetical protein
MVGQGDPTRIRLYGGKTGTAAGNNPLYSRAMNLRSRGSMARLIPGHRHDGGEDWFGRSDHYVFSAKGVPSVMYLGKAGRYHTPRDDMASIDIKTNRAVARHALRLVAEMANDPVPSSKGHTLPFSSLDTGFAGNVYSGH